MNKIKLFLPLVLTGGLTSAITSCSCSQDQTKLVTLELSQKVRDKGVSIISSNIEYGKNSYMILGLPDGKLISDVAIKADTSDLDKNDVNINDNKITIPADKMNCDKVVLDNITLEAEPEPKPTGPTDFSQCSWSELDQWCQKLELGQIDEATFCSHFAINGQQLTSLDQFIGLEKNVLINNINHVVRVVDTQHDTIDLEGELNGKLAVLTFELVSVLCDSQGNPIYSRWHSKASNYDYGQYQLRANLTGNGGATRSWDITALQMLEDSTSGTPSLVNAIKPTIHYYAKSNNWIYGTITEEPYSDKLYVPAYGNMTTISSEDCKETLNLPYAYYQQIESESEEAAKVARIKQDLNGNIVWYWLASPHTGYITSPWIIESDGSLSHISSLWETVGVCFNFCI